MNRKISYVEHIDSEDLVHWIDLEIDDQVFQLDKGDVWNLWTIVNTVFDRMIDRGEGLDPKIYSQIISKERPK
jgi:hypothetical protein